ncbi:hypothetical protein ACJMK2_015660 [Sinanodonta woodiana]|uniref:Cysteine and tyrosine-rich protein 1 n=1 Tax=Sinanodonta woodiana TaxID=1069815 RepID=A0ABD3USB3_SINWO
MAHVEVYVLTFLTVLVGHVKSDICYSNSLANDLDCPYGCCGTSYSQYCCDYSSVRYSSYSTYISGGTIAGIVVGCLVGIALLIGAIVFCCCLQRRRATNGQILYAQGNPGFTMTTGTTITGTQMPTTQMAPGMYAPPYAPQMAGGYTPNNAAVNNSYGSPPPAYDQAAKA